MALIVTKFGGTSLATTERIKDVAQLIIDKVKAGDQIVVVVSAMGSSTDNLLKLADSINEHPSDREKDRLLSTGEQVSMTLVAMALQAKGYKSMSFTGRQAGIMTDGRHAKAKILSINSPRIKKALKDGYIPVIAGFQGIDATSDMNTLGRGGSDTTAVAMAWAIGADLCEIYSDVEGVYTADPRICPRARKLDYISYDDMLELSSAGSGVLQLRAVEFAKKWNVPICCRSTFSKNAGTIIKGGIEVEEAVVSGIAYDSSQVKFTIRRVPDVEGISAQLFGALSAEQISVDMIIQNISEDGYTDISFTCSIENKEKAAAVVKKIAPCIKAGGYSSESDICKVSLVGTGMISNSNVAACAFRTLADNNINILAIATSPIRLSLVVKKSQQNKTVQCLHTAFGLDSDSIFEENALSEEELAAKAKKGR